MKDALLNGAARLAMSIPGAEALLIRQSRRHSRAARSLCYRLSSRTPDPLRVVKLPTGAGLLIDIRDIYRELYIDAEPYEREVTDAFLSIVRPGDTVVDVGANGGYFSILAASLGARVHAFEPVPRLAALVRESARINGFDVVVNEAALSDASGEADFYLSTDPANSGINTFERLPLEYEPTRVRTLTLDEYGAGQCRLVKIDVERGEPAVIRGMGRTLRESPPDFIICEVEEGSTADEQLAAFGYRPRPLSKTGRMGDYLYSRP